MHFDNGIVTAIITPFKGDEIDYDSVDSLVERQINAGVKTISPSGTTGEAPNLSEYEFEKLIDRVVSKANKRAKILVGVGTNSTATTLKKLKIAENCKADSVLIVTPYYNRPTQEGLIAHYTKCSESTDLPIMLYNVPPRTGVSIAIDTVAKLSECKNIVALKEGESVAKIVELKKLLPKEFQIFSGDDINSLAYNEVGGSGCVSVASNIFPKEFVQMHNLWFNGKKEEALSILENYKMFIETLFIETNPTPVKYFAELMGLCSADVRLPLVRPRPSSIDKITEIFEYHTQRQNVKSS